LLEQPKIFVKIIENELLNAQKRLIMDLNKPLSPTKFKPFVKPRFTGMPITQDTYFHRVPALKYQGKLTAICGTVVRTGSIKMMERRRIFQCVRCKFCISVDADLSQHGIIPKPPCCPAKIDGQSCLNTKFVLANSETGRELLFE